MANPGYQRIVGVPLGTTYNFPASTDLQNRMIERCVLTCDTTLGPITINMPAIASLGGFLNMQIVVVDVANNALVNNITVNADGTDLINGLSNNIIATNGAIISYAVASVDAPDLWTATINNLIPSGAIVSPFLTNLVYVDAVNGDDTTGLPYRIDKSFQTIAAAEAVANPGDTIYVYPGLNNLAAAIGVTNLNYYFCPGAIVRSAGAIINAISGEFFNIFGYARFVSTGGTAMTFDLGSVVQIQCDSIDGRLQAVSVDGGAFVSIVVNGADGIVALGNGVIVNESNIGDGTVCHVVTPVLNAGATAFATIGPGSDTLIASCNCSGEIISRNGAIDAFAVNHIGGILTIRGNSRKVLIAGGASTLNLHPLAGAAARLTYYGDIICPSAGLNVQLGAGIALIYGNLHGGNINLGGGKMIVTGSNGIHQWFGQTTCGSNADAVEVDGGVLYHEGRVVNTSAGLLANGYRVNAEKCLALRGGNSISLASAAGISIDDGGGLLTVLLYGQVVANKAAAATVVPGVGSLIVDADVV